MTGASEEGSSATFRSVLLQNSPNPFNPFTTIHYEVSEAAWVTVDVYSVDGRLVRKLACGLQEPGRYDVLWDGRDATGQGVASGVYLCRAQIGQFDGIRKMVLLK
jgi:hypothetical protein